MKTYASSCFSQSPTLCCSITHASPRDVLVAVGTEDGRIHVLHYVTVPTFTFKSVITPSTTSKQHADAVNCVAFSPTDLRLVSGSSDKSVSLWRVQNNASTNTWTMPHIKTMTGHSKIVKTCSWAPNGNWFATAGQDRSIMTWMAPANGSAPSESSKSSIIAHQDNILSIHVRPMVLGDGKGEKMVIVSGSWDRHVKVWEVVNQDTLQLVQLGSYTGMSHFVNAVAISPNKLKVAVGSPDHMVRID
jgi:WD40 repeat protein